MSCHLDNAHNIRATFLGVSSFLPKMADLKSQGRFETFTNELEASPKEGIPHVEVAVGEKTASSPPKEPENKITSVEGLLEERSRLAE